MLYILVALLNCNACYPPPVPPPPPPCPTVITINPPIANFLFLSPDTIVAKALLDPSGRESQVQWIVTASIGSISNLTPANATGPDLSFKPQVTHPVYLSNGSTVGANGSEMTSDPLSYDLGAEVSVCNKSTTRVITQDETDIIRQEYQHHSISIPSRAALHLAPQASFFTPGEINPTAYSKIVGDPGAIADAVRNEYNLLIKAELGLQTTPNYGLVLSSSWRNPERNEYWLGLRNSNHQYGKAVDLKRLLSTSGSTGLTDSRLWELLAQAGNNVANVSFCEFGALAVSCAAMVSHVHVHN